MVLLTYPLFLREILEAKKLADHIYSPITLVSGSVAQFLFPEYPVQVRVNVERLKQENPDKLMGIGSMLIADGDLTISPEAIIEVAAVNKVKPLVERMLYSRGLERAAVIQIGRGMFKTAPTDRELKVDSHVVRKSDKAGGRIVLLEPGEAGGIHVEMDDGSLIVTSKIAFDRFFVIPTDKVAQARQVDIGQLIKEKLKNTAVIQKLAKEYEVSLDRLDELQVVVLDLKDKFAETDKDTMKLNATLFENGIEAFFRDSFFIVVHEIVHWLTRVKEQDAYFNDPEEVLGFVASIAYELTQSSDLEAIWQKIYPKVAWHFHDEKDARLFFERSIQKAKKLLQEP